MRKLAELFRRWFARRADYKVKVVAQSHAYGDHVREYIMDRDADGKLNLRKWAA